VPTTHYIDEKQVTLPLLLEVFQQAQFEASINDQGILMVLAETALVSVDVQTAENVRLIRFTSMYKMRDTASIEQKMALANKLNDGVILARFSILETDHQAMNVVYHLPFWGGIDEYHIVIALRLFTHVYAGAPSVMDTQNLIEYGTYPVISEQQRSGQVVH
jgi:hypothetical protein